MFANDETIKSNFDDSVNFVCYTPDGGAMEARYVRRDPRYFIAYLSSHTGCNMACRMCHLTQTGQTMMRAVSEEEYAEQANEVIDHYYNIKDEDGQEVEQINFNFMARGEPLLNPSFMSHSEWRSLRARLENEVYWLGTGVKRTEFNVSSILPKQSAEISLAKVFGKDPEVRLYYSLYSMKPSFRRRWLPNAMAPNAALDRLAEYQAKTGNEVALHWAFIEGENDDVATLEEIIDAVNKRGLKTKFNLVRYNPFSIAQGKEPSEEVIQRNFEILATAFGQPTSRIVPRVGFDAKVSCGMFVANDRTSLPDIIA